MRPTSSPFLPRPQTNQALIGVGGGLGEKEEEEDKPLPPAGEGGGEREKGRKTPPNGWLTAYNAIWAHCYWAGADKEETSTIKGAPPPLLSIHLPLFRGSGSFLATVIFYRRIWPPCLCLWGGRGCLIRNLRIG